MTRRLIIDVGYFVHKAVLRAIKDYLFYIGSELMVRLSDDRGFPTGVIRIEVSGPDEKVESFLRQLERWSDEHELPR